MKLSVLAKKKKLIRELPATSLRITVDTFYQLQKDRLNHENKRRSLKQGYDISDKFTHQLVESNFEENAERERLHGEIITIWAKNNPAARIAMETCGIGPILSAAMLSCVDFSKIKSVGNLLSYFGYAPGKNKLIKGQKCTFNRFLKSKGYMMGLSFILNKHRDNCIYGKVFEIRTAMHVKKNRDREEKWTPDHIKNASRQYSVIRFLHDIVGKWEKAGLFKPYNIVPTQTWKDNAEAYVRKLTFLIEEMREEVEKMQADSKKRHASKIKESKDKIETTEEGETEEILERMVKETAMLENKNKKMRK